MNLQINCIVKPGIKPQIRNWAAQSHESHRDNDVCDRLLGHCQCVPNALNQYTPSLALVTVDQVDDDVTRCHHTNGFTGQNQHLMNATTKVWKLPIAITI